MSTTPNHDAVYPGPSVTLDELAETLVLPASYLPSLGIIQVNIPGPALRVPYRGTNGTEVAVRLITSLTEPGANRWGGKSKARP